MQLFCHHGSHTDVVLGAVKAADRLEGLSRYEVAEGAVPRARGSGETLILAACSPGSRHCDGSWGIFLLLSEELGLTWTHVLNFLPKKLPLLFFFFLFPNPLSLFITCTEICLPVQVA